jgi:outer membrane murein-binding lipoprotein Lpp
LVLDFAGNSGKHSVVCTVDVLAGGISERKANALKTVLEESAEPKTIDEAEQELKNRAIAERLAQSEAKRKNIQAEVEYTVERFKLGDACEDIGVHRDYLYAKYGLNPATEAQMAGLEKWMGKNARRLPEDLSKHEAARMLTELSNRKRDGFASYGQVVFLGKKGIDARPWAFSKASSVIDWIATHNWINPPQSVIDGAR